MKKRVLALFMVFAMVFAMMPIEVLAASWRCEGNDHVYSILTPYVKTETQHSKTCKCGAETKTEDHTYLFGYCVCLDTCDHRWGYKNSDDAIAFANSIDNEEVKNALTSLMEKISFDKKHILMCEICYSMSGEEHTFNVEAPTCVLDKECTKCGEIVDEALGHTKVSDATCEVQAICSVCGSYGELADCTWSSATCEDPATCSVCGNTKDAALGHDWQDATCTEPGKCGNEGCTAIDPENPNALDHDWQDATCTEPKTCKRSGCNETDGEKLGHDYIKDFDKTNHWEECSRCEDVKNKNKHTLILGKCIGCDYTCEHPNPTYVTGDNVNSIISLIDKIPGLDNLVTKLQEISFEEYHGLFCGTCYTVDVKLHDYAPATFSKAKTCACGYFVGNPLTVEANGETVEGDVSYKLGLNQPTIAVEIKVNDGNGGYLDTSDVTIELEPSASLDALAVGEYNVKVTANNDTFKFDIVVNPFTPPTREEILESIKEKLQDEYENWKEIVENKIEDSELGDLYSALKKFDKEDIDLLRNLLETINEENISTILELAKDGIGIEDLTKIAEILPDLSADEVLNLLDVLAKVDDSIDEVIKLLEKIDTSEIENVLDELNKIDTSKLEEVLKALENIEKEDIETALENLKDKTEQEIKNFIDELEGKTKEQIKELVDALKEKESEIKDKLEELEKQLKEEIKNILDEAFENHSHIYKYEDENSCKCVVPNCTATNNPHNYSEITLNYEINLKDLVADADIELNIDEIINIDETINTSATEIKNMLKDFETEVGKVVDLDKAYKILGAVGISMDKLLEEVDKYTEVDIAELENKIKTTLTELKEKIKDAEIDEKLDLNDLYCKVEICTSCGHIKVTEHVESDWTSASDTEHIKTCTNTGCDKELDRATHTLSEEYITTEKTHKQECDACDYETIEEDHNFVDGICEVCKYECKHEGEDGDTCSNCGEELNNDSNKDDEEPVVYTISSVKVNNKNATKSLEGNTFSYGTLSRGTKKANVTFTLEGELKENEVKVKIGSNEAKFTSNVLTVEITGLSNGANSKTVELLVNGEVVETYTLSIRVSSSSGSSSGGGSSRPSAAAQDLLIVTTDVGSAAQLKETSKGTITISEKYTDEIIKKAEGGVNFTGSAVASPNVTSIKFTAKLLKQLSEREDSKITEIGVDTKDASMRVKLSEILDKGDITITVKEATSLTSLQKKMANGAKLYNVEIKSSKNGVIETFGKNVEITLPYELKENEDPDTITIFEVDKDGKISNLRGTYNDETAYCLVKELNNPVMVIANPVEFIDYVAPLWAKTYVNQMASKNILLGQTANSYSPERLSVKEFSELLRNLLGIDAQISDSNNSISREETANIISDMMEGKEEYNIKFTNKSNLDDMHEVSEHHEEAVNFAIRAGIMVGYADDTFQPDNGLTRTEAAVVFTKIFRIINVF